jgi:quinol monooxygenase YgiN
MIIITGSVQIHPEHRDAGFALGIEHSRRSRGEPGCLAHNCHADAEDENRMVFHEEWADMAAVKVHFAVPESGEFVHRLAAMAVTPPVMRIFMTEEVPIPRA